MKKREYYENLFASYPDVVTLQEFREMLGGIGDGTARKLMRGNHVKHYYIRHTYRALTKEVLEIERKTERFRNDAVR